MISESAIMGKLQAYANSTTGKKRMKEVIESAQRTGRPLASGEMVVSVKQMTDMANALADMIRRRLPESIADVGSTLVSTVPVKRPDGSYEVVLKFDLSALHRDSLDNDLGYDGISNIVALFNNGYHAKNYVYGWWEGHRPTGESVFRSGPLQGDYAWVRSEKEREALQFMQDAVAEFNTVYGSKYGVVVGLGSDYTTE